MQESQRKLCTSKRIGNSLYEKKQLFMVMAGQGHCSISVTDDVFFANRLSFSARLSHKTYSVTTFYGPLETNSICCSREQRRRR